MAYKSVVVHLDEDRCHDTRLDIGVNLAKRSQAKLIGIYPAQTYLESSARPDFEPLNIVKVCERESRLRESMKIKFLEATERESVKSEWRVATEPMTRELEASARYSDLVVVGQEDPETAAQALSGQLIIGSGIPIIAVPYAGEFKAVGARVLVGWDGSREAIRAIRDAMPILLSAEKVRVCEVNPSSDRSSKDITAHLAEHGVNAESYPTVSRLPPIAAAVFGPRSLGVGALLLSAANDFGADLLVMGAYGHSRLHELVLGGATRHVLRHMTLPVLMSH